jgi:P-type E1-E2 ATPase
VEQAEQSQASVQKLADRVAVWLIPVVLVFLVAVFLVTHDVRKVVTLLVFTLPAELGLATPMVMIAGIARAARSGTLIKGGVYLELLAKIVAMAIDKTGTLTVGQPVVQKVDVLNGSMGERKLLRLAAAPDPRSAHPLNSVLRADTVQKNFIGRVNSLRM